jgi:hypothetical protein
MKWTDIGGFSIAAGRAVYDYWIKDPKDREERARMHQEVLHAIRSSTSLVLDTMVALNLAQLKGEVEGLMSRFATYEPDALNKNEENRLINIIDGASDTLGILHANIELLPPAKNSMEAPQEKAFLNLALESAALQMSLVFLRIHAMVERERTFGAEEIKDVPAVLDRTIAVLSPVVRNLKIRSDSRFSSLRTMVSSGPGPRVSFFAFDFNGAPVPCFLTQTPDALRKSEQRRRERIDEEFNAYQGGAGPAVTQVIELMKKMRSEPVR